MKPRLVTPLGPLSEYEEAEREEREAELARKREVAARAYSQRGADMNRIKRERRAAGKAA